MEHSGAPRVVAGTALALLVLLIFAVTSAAGVVPYDGGIDLPIER